MTSPRLPVAALIATAALALMSCAGADGRSDVGSETAAAGADTRDTTTTTTTEVADEGVLYAQHALLGTSDLRAGGPLVLTLVGVDQTTTWFAANEAGVTETGSFVENWQDNDWDGDPPQAALVPADPLVEPILLTLTNPTWDAEARTLTYEVGVPELRDARLHDIAPNAEARLPEAFSSAFLYIVQGNEGEVPAPTPTTTTTSTTSTTTTTTTAPAQPTQPPTNPVPTPPPPPPPTPPPPPPPTQPPPPTGEANITVSPTTVILPGVGGTDTFVVRNIGEGIGSWSAAAPVEQGISAAPSSGFLLPGSSTTVTVTYGGGGPTGDFSDTLPVIWARGTVFVTVIVNP